MAPPVVGIGTLRRLGELDTAGHPVLSVYLGLDPGTAACAAACEHQLDGLFADAQRQAVEADASRLRELLRGMPALAHGTRGLALFSSAEGAACAAVALPSAVEPMAVVDTLPWLEPLAGLFTAGDCGVAVIDRRAARLFRGAPRLLVEFAAVHDERHRRRAPGDCSQPSCTCPTEEHLAEHARRLAGLLLRAHRRRAFDQLTLVASSELWPVLEGALHDELRDRIAGLVELELMEAPAQEIACMLARHLRREQMARRARTNRTGPPLPVAISTAHGADVLARV